MRMPTAKELGDLLPDWWSTRDPRVRLDYVNLKAAALALAHAPEAERRNVISAYSWAYCEMTMPDLPRASGMYLLLRILFVLPTRHPSDDTRSFSAWERPSRGVGDTAWDLSWPVHVDPSGDVAQVDRCLAWQGRHLIYGYLAYTEYEYFAAQFPLRSPKAIEALEIK